MRISDWSSDVCSSDLVVSQLAGAPNNLDNYGFAATEVTNALADLRVTSVVPAAPATPALSGEKTSLTYSVENQGGPVWSGTQYWTDDIWISKDPVFDVSRAQKVATVEVSNGPLGSGESYSRTVDFTMPPGVEGEYYVYVIANSAGRNPIAGDIVRSGSNSGLLGQRSEEHTSELQSLMRISYAVFCLK